METVRYGANIQSMSLSATQNLSSTHLPLKKYSLDDNDSKTGTLTEQ